MKTISYLFSAIQKLISIVANPEFWSTVITAVFSKKVSKGAFVYNITWTALMVIGLITDTAVVVYSCFMVIGIVYTFVIYKKDILLNRHTTVCIIAVYAIMTAMVFSTILLTALTALSAITVVINACVIVQKGFDNSSKHCFHVF